MDASASSAIELIGLSKTYHIGGLATSDGTTTMLRRVNLARSDDQQSISRPDEEKHA